jgi:hypothetical protein
MAAIMFIHGVYRVITLGLLTGTVIDNDWAGGMASLGISIYFGLELCGMAAKADEAEHFLDEVMTGWPT